MKIPFFKSFLAFFIKKRKKKEKKERKRKIKKEDEKNSFRPIQTCSQWIGGLHIPVPSP